MTLYFDRGIFLLGTPSSISSGTSGSLSEHVHYVSPDNDQSPGGLPIFALLKGGFFNKRLKVAGRKNYVISVTSIVLLRIAKQNLPHQLSLQRESRVSSPNAFDLFCLSYR